MFFILSAVLTKNIAFHACSNLILLFLVYVESAFKYLFELDTADWYPPLAGGVDYPTVARGLSPEDLAHLYSLLHLQPPVNSSSSLLPLSFLTGQKIFRQKTLVFPWELERVIICSLMH